MAQNQDYKKEIDFLLEIRAKNLTCAQCKHNEAQGKQKKFYCTTRGQNRYANGLGCIKFEAKEKKV